MTEFATFTSQNGRSASKTGRQLLVAFRGVDKVFANQVTALSGLDLDIRAGEFLALLGPSGCGKSTVLRLLSGLTPPTRGEITWGCDRPEFGFVFQEPTLMPWSDVFHNVVATFDANGTTTETQFAIYVDGIRQQGLIPASKQDPPPETLSKITGDNVNNFQVLNRGATAQRLSEVYFLLT